MIRNMGSANSVLKEQARSEMKDSDDTLYEYVIGDIVRVPFQQDGKDKQAEGIVVERLDLTTIRVEIGDSMMDFQTIDCVIIVKSEDFELNDLVEMRPVDSALYFRGIVQAVNEDGTLDILIEGDDNDDVETNVRRDNVRKLMSTRSLAYMRWKKAFNAVMASRRFSTMGPPVLTASMSGVSLHSVESY